MHCGARLDHGTVRQQDVVFVDDVERVWAIVHVPLSAAILL